MEVSAPDALVGGLLVAIALSVVLLPFVATETNFRLMRRVEGSDDAAVIASYGFGGRYVLFNELGRSYAGANYLVVDDSWTGWNIHQQLVAFARAGRICALKEGQVDMTYLQDAVVPLAESLASWEFEHRGLGYSVAAGPEPERFLVIAEASGIRAVDADLLPPGFDRVRCEYVG